jgi:hypothetical protein
MPIEIRELVIKAVIGQEGQSTGNAATGGNTGSSNEETIKACVEKVMELLKEKNER